eukprot:351320-Chlamydomonas_euryale.AAC.2
MSFVAAPTACTCRPKARLIRGRSFSCKTAGLTQVRRVSNRALQGAGQGALCRVWKVFGGSVMPRDMHGHAGLPHRFKCARRHHVLHACWQAFHVLHGAVVCAVLHGAAVCAVLHGAVVCAVLHGAVVYAPHPHMQPHPRMQTNPIMHACNFTVAHTHIHTSARTHGDAYAHAHAHAHAHA